MDHYIMKSNNFIKIILTIFAAILLIYSYQMVLSVSMSSNDYKESFPQPPNINQQQKPQNCDKQTQSIQITNQQPQVSNHQQPIAAVRISRKRPLNLAFQFDYRPVDQGGRIFETDWIQQVLLGSNLDRPVRVLPRGDQLMNDTLYIFLFEPSPKDLFTQLKQKGFVNCGGLHMGDESGDGVSNYYSEASYILRNYYFRRYDNRTSNILHIPLGTKTGLGLHWSATAGNFIPASRRMYLYNFVGSVRANRGYMLEQVKYARSAAERTYVSSDKGWADPSGVHVVHYRQVLLDSRFTLCPFGNNEESLRFYEALEAGSIPLSERSKNGQDFIVNGLNGGSTADLPLPFVNDWKEADALLEHYDKNPELLDKLQEDVMRWWAGRKAAALKRIEALIEDSFKQAHGDNQ